MRSVFLVRLSRSAKVIFGTYLVSVASPLHAQACISECRAAYRGDPHPFTKFYNPALVNAIQGDVDEATREVSWCRTIQEQDAKGTADDLRKFIAAFENADKEYLPSVQRDNFRKYKQCMLTTKASGKPVTDVRSETEPEHSGRASGSNSSGSDGGKTQYDPLQPGADDPVSEDAMRKASACLSPEPGTPRWVLGYVRNQCLTEVTYAYCVQPREGVFSGMKCGVKFQYGRIAGAEVDSVDTRGTAYWVGCPAPSTPQGLKFVPGRGIWGTCK